jgi:hypothetical protein
LHSFYMTLSQSNRMMWARVMAALSRPDKDFSHPTPHNYISGQSLISC